MKMINDTLKKEMERNIANHFIELNKNNHTLAIDIHNFDVKLFATTNNHKAELYWQASNVVGHDQNGVDINSEYWFRYRYNGEEYRLILNDGDAFLIRNLDDDGNLIEDEDE